MDINEYIYSVLIKSRKKADILIKKYHSSIDFNKEIFNHTILYYIIKYKSIHANFILNLYFNSYSNHIYLTYFITQYGSYKAFKFIISKLNILFKNGESYSIFYAACCYRSLKFVKLFINTLSFSNLANYIYYSRALEAACYNKINVFSYLFRYVDINLHKLILFNAIKNMDILNFILKYDGFNLNEKNKYCNTIIHYINNTKTIKLLLKYDGNFDLESKDDINNKAIDNTDSIKVFKLLRKYMNSNNKLFSNNTLFDNPEIFKFIKN